MNFIITLGPVYHFANQFELEIIQGIKIFTEQVKVMRFLISHIVSLNNCMPFSSHACTALMKLSFISLRMCSKRVTDQTQQFILSAKAH